MNTTHDNARTWRDLRDQLTAEQISRLSGMEARTTMAPSEIAAALLEGARRWAAGNLAGRVLFSHVPAPAGVRQVFDWGNDGTGRWSRRFDGSKRGTSRVHVDIEGSQYADGTIERAIVVDADGVSLTAAAARDIADSLNAAADELDELS
jgi:hypothetical protein